MAYAIAALITSPAQPGQHRFQNLPPTLVATSIRWSSARIPEASSDYYLWRVLYKTSEASSQR